MVKVGIAGLGMMGVTHFHAWRTVDSARVAAVHTRDETKLAGDWAAVRGNLGDISGAADLTGVARYRQLDEMIADDSIDLLDVCLPTGLHAQVTVRALEAGHNVLVEKPIADSLEDADRMIAAAKANGRLLMVAHVVRFFPQWSYLRSLIASGEFGPLRGLQLKRIIAMPDWGHARTNQRATGGPLIDLHIHDIDFLLYLLGKPKRLFAMGRDEGGVITYAATTYDYGHGLIASCTSGVASTKGRKFIQQYDAYFENATVTHARATEPKDIDPAARQSAAQMVTVYHRDGSATFPVLDKRDGFALQLQHAADCVATSKPSSIIDARFGRESLAMVFEEEKSIRGGCVVDLS